MASSWPTAISQNLAANFLWALPTWISSGGMAIWLGYMNGLSLPWLLLIGVSTLFITVLVIALRATRERRPGRPEPSEEPSEEEQRRAIRERLEREELEKLQVDLKVRAAANRLALMGHSRSPLVKDAEAHVRSLGLPDKTYTVINNDGTPQNWTRPQLDELPDEERARLFQIHGGLGRWWLGAEKNQ